MKKTTSPQRIAANRRNARKSTGPRTRRGRKISRMNACKHGLLSRDVLVQGQQRTESRRDLDALHEKFWAQLKPLGAVEEMLVNQIVTAYWRWQRALAAEAGEIALEMDEGHWQRHRPKAPALQWLEWEEAGDPITAMESCSLGCRIIAGWLRGVREAVERDGELTEAGLKEATQGRNNRLTRDLEELRARLTQNPEGLEPAAQQARNKQEALEELDLQLRVVALRKSECDEREEKAEQARQAAAALPTLATMDKIQRYETKLERQMYRAMAQLERVQRMRRGEKISAPVSGWSPERG